MFEKLLADINQFEKWKYYLSREHFLVLDIGTYGMKVMEIKRKQTQYTIEKAYYLPEMGKYFKGKDIINLSGVTENLLNILHIENIKARDVFVTFSTSKLQAKVVKIPDVNEKELKGFVEIEFQKQFPNNSRLTDIMDYMSVGKFKKDEMTNQMILMSVLSASEATSLIKEFQNKKFFVKVIDVDVHALSNVSQINRSEKTDKVIFDIGNENSHLVFMRGNTTVFSRQINFGLNTLVKTIQNEADISIKDAERIFEEVGLRAKEDIHVKGYQSISKDVYNEIIDDSFGGALNEAYRSFQFVNTNFGLDVEKVILTGGITRVKEAVETCQSILDVDTEAWSFEKDAILEMPDGCVIVNNTGKRIEGTFAICFGMAVRGHFS